MRAIDHLIAAAVVIAATCCVRSEAQTVPVSFAWEAEHYSATLGGDTANGFRNKLVRLGEGEWLRYDSVSFMDGTFDSLSVLAVNWWDMDYGWVRVRIDGVSGTIIASVYLANNLGDPNRNPAWATVPLDVRPEGVHDVYVTFEGGDDVAELDRFSLSGNATVIPSDARDYFVATYGTDDNNGLSPDLPFRTIQRAALVMKPGSRCFIRQGVYRESVRPAYSGVAGSPLVFQPYASEEVYISGADSVGGWTRHSGDIYKAPMPWNIGEYDDQVLVDGEMAINARAPGITEDVGYFDNFVGDERRHRGRASDLLLPTLMRFSDYWERPGEELPVPAPYTSENSFPEWLRMPDHMPAPLAGMAGDALVGGLAILYRDWCATPALIVGHSPITPSSSDMRLHSLGWQRVVGHMSGYISHAFPLLDEPNEWFRQDSTLYLWAPNSDNPGSHVVEAKRRRLIFDLGGKEYVNLIGLRFLAGNVSLANARHCTIDRCRLKYISHTDVVPNSDVGIGWWDSPNDPCAGPLAFNRGIPLSGSDNQIINSLVAFSSGSGIWLDGTNNTIANCRVRDCDYGPTSYLSGIYFNSHHGGAVNCRVSRNSIYAMGRSCIQLTGAGWADDNTHNVIEYNDFYLSSLRSDESAAIYVYGPAVQWMHIRNNWFHDNNAGWGKYNIGLDAGGYHYRIYRNVFWRGDPVAGDTTHNLAFDATPERDNIVYNNTFVDAFYAERTECPSLNALHVTSGDTAFWRFADPVRRAYWLRDGSPAIDSGQIIPGRVESYEGSAPDLGAYEHGETPWVPGADWEEEPWDYPPRPAAVGAIRAPKGRIGRASVVVSRAGALVVSGMDGPKARVNVFNARGVCLTSVSANCGRSVMTIPMAGVGAGTYLVCIERGNARQVHRVVVRR